MGIALFSAATLIESLQGVIGWLAPREQRPAASHNTPPEVWHRPKRMRVRSGPSSQSIGQAVGRQAHAGIPAKHSTDHATAPLLPCAVASRQVTRNLRVQRPLRVVRVMYATGSSASSACAGRMVISGRMADVCAELDRLAALEATPSSMMSLA